jgi:hypothetical protein
VNLSVLAEYVHERPGTKLTPSLFPSNGNQIEQSKDARKDFHKEIVDAVANVIGPRIKICTTPVFEDSDPWTCLMNSIGYSVRAMLRSGVISIPCEIRRLLFHIRNCHRGNTDPYIEL